MTATDVQRAYDEARFFMANGRLNEAAARCERALAIEPMHAGALFLRGVIALEQRDPARASHYLQQAVAVDPDNASAHTQFARSEIFNKRFDTARASAERALVLGPTDALSFDTLGVVFSHVGDHAQAAEVFRRAAAANPSNASFQYNLGTSLKFAGDLDGAEAALESSIALDPQLHKARYALSHLRRQTPERNHVDDLLERWQTVNAATDDLLYLGYALAKEYDDLGQYDAAWNTLAGTNRQWNERSGYRPEQDEALFESLMTTFAAPTGTAGDDSAEPLFVVGLPRSGTTLAERILSSHGRVTSAGELNNFALLTKQLSASRSPALIDSDIVRQSASIPRAELGRRYIESTRPVTGNTPHFVDKLPHNFLYLGLILEALPNARVVCMRRDPLDVCLGNLRQLFAPGHPFFGYAYEPMHCARYYMLFDRLMRHWRTLYPGRILELRYEGLVADQAGVTRALLDHCGLPWEDACLDFAGNAAPVATASAAQVREPLNARGIGRWRNYADNLQGVIRILRENGIEVEAEPQPTD